MGNLINNALESQTKYIARRRLWRVQNSLVAKFWDCLINNTGVLPKFRTGLITSGGMNVAEIRDCPPAAMGVDEPTGCSPPAMQAAVRLRVETDVKDPDRQVGLSMSACDSGLLTRRIDVGGPLI